MSELTSLVHAAYAPLAEAGFRFWGTWQSEDDTRLRCSEGSCLVAEDEGRLVGTVTVKRSQSDDDPPWYRRDGVWIVTQFAVAPHLQGSGLGSLLLTAAERHAFENRGCEAAIDTAEGALRLIDFYARRGYRRVGSVDWEGTNYVSVVMSKRLRPRLSTERLFLRDLTLDDVSTIQSHWSDVRFQANYPPGRLTPEHCSEVFEKEVGRLAKYPRTGHAWAIEKEGTMIGTIGLALESSATGKIGYGIAADHWGQGIATEAVREVVRYGFEELSLHRVHAWVYSTNVASQRVLEKLGFKYEGALREKVDWGDTRVDDNIYGLLRHEWAGRS